MWSLLTVSNKKPRSQEISGDMQYGYTKRRRNRNMFLCTRLISPAPGEKDLRCAPSLQRTDLIISHRNRSASQMDQNLRYSMLKGIHQKAWQASEASLPRGQSFLRIAGQQQAYRTHVDVSRPRHVLDAVYKETMRIETSLSARRASEQPTQVELMSNHNLVVISSCGKQAACET